MSIISSCDCVITTTRTFSWWIEYLSKGNVLYYKKFPKEGSWLKATVLCYGKLLFFGMDWLKIVFRTTLTTNPRTKN